jgi:hypothetical protein
MGRRGRKRQLEVEARYWQLLLSGVGTIEACRKVGITRKTGYRWRAKVGGLVPVRLGEAVRSNRYLSLLERQRIAALHGQGVSVCGTTPRRCGTGYARWRSTREHGRGRPPVMLPGWPSSPSVLVVRLVPTQPTSCHPLQVAEAEGDGEGIAGRRR